MNETRTYRLRPLGENREPLTDAQFAEWSFSDIANVLVLRTDLPLTYEIAERAQKEAQKTWPGRRIAVVDQAVHFFELEQVDGEEQAG